MLDKATLEDLYITQNLSVSDTAKVLGVSAHKVNWWMDKYGIRRRSLSDAIFAKNRRSGRPHQLKPITTLADARLLGLGMGLYWGEGNKANRHSVRLGNTDANLIKTFMDFLITLFDVDKQDLRFGLQIFTDIDPQQALHFWQNSLGVDASQFYKITVTISGSIGTYRHKSKHGVLTVYYNNSRLRDTLVSMLP
jgi:hypothetical protein